MRVSEVFAAGRPVFSFEFFPPRTPEGETALFRTIAELKELRPSFVTMTYGAGGSTRAKTVEWVSRIRNEIGIEAVAHLTCVGHARGEIGRVLDDLRDRGIDNVLALRGDPPKGETGFRPHPDGFRYAHELVSFLRGRGDPFCVGVAGYPERHPEAPSAEADVAHLERKVAAGADFVTTQLFFDPGLYVRFVERARAAGVAVPILPGVMPVTNLGQMKKFTEMCGASIPPALMRALDEAEGAGRVEEAGVAWATEQCRALLAAGAPGIHFYTLNKSPATRRILSAIRP